MIINDNQLMDEFEQSDVEKEANDSHDTFYQDVIQLYFLIFCYKAMSANV